jgi:hypothetical protein
METTSTENTFVMVQEQFTIAYSGFKAVYDTCPKCGHQKGLPVTHDEELDGETLTKIACGKLIWIRLLPSANPYRCVINRKCICCEFEWREHDDYAG